MTPPRYCPCGFQADAIKRFSAEWHRAHQRWHLLTWPNVDQTTRDNLATFIALAEKREAS